MEEIATTGLAVATHTTRSSLSCINGLIGLASLIYSIVLTVNALSATSGKGRWAVFGIYLGTVVIVSTVLLYVPASIAYAFGIHLLAQ